MYKKMFAMMLIALFAIFGLWNAQPVAAYTGIQLIVRDSVNNAPWQWRGDVYLVNQTTGDIAATGILGANGQATILHGSGSLCDAVGGCIAPLNGHVIEIIIDFTCQISLAEGLTQPGDCPSPNGIPNTFGESTYTQNNVPVLITRNVQTGTGPSAVTLNSIGVATGSGIAIYLVVAVMMALMATAVLVARRNQTA